MRKTQQTLWLAGFTGVSTACIISLLTTDISSVDRPSASQPHALLAANINQDQLVTLHEVRQMLEGHFGRLDTCLLYTSPSPRDATLSRMPSSA